MKPETYYFVARPLPYEPDALVPVLDEKTLYFHHDKHYQTYVNNLNNALADYPELHNCTLRELLIDSGRLPAAARKSIDNNGGGVYNHELYFDSMQTPMGQCPEGSLKDSIDRDFGSYKEWRDELKSLAASVFGSGWVHLITDKYGKLDMCITRNQDVPNLKEWTPILNLDLWEHAYYLQYQNRRLDYVEGFIRLINWRKALRRYEDAFGK